MQTDQAIEMNQYLTFSLAQEDFALEISHVREVLDFTTITRIPRTPPFMLGVINLRGNVVPVIDLRLILGMKSGERTVDTCIVITEVEMDGELIQIGALADSVQEVLEIDDSQIEPPPRIGARLKTEFIKGMGKRDDLFIIILDVERVLSTEELSALKDIGANASLLPTDDEADEAELET